MTRRRFPGGFPHGRSEVSWTRVEIIDEISAEILALTSCLCGRQRRSEMGVFFLLPSRQVDVIQLDGFTTPSPFLQPGPGRKSLPNCFQKVKRKLRPNLSSFFLGAP